MHANYTNEYEFKLLVSICIIRMNQYISIALL